MQMTINYAILGLLDSKSMTGYDLKKIIQDSSFMYWSGNNNQIYKALLELNDLGYVTNEVEHQEGAPSKKIYTITNDGRNALKKKALQTSGLPEIKNPFMIQLAFADALSEDELNSVLDEYEEMLNKQIQSTSSKVDENSFKSYSERSKAILNLINENINDYYKNELEWIQKIKLEIKDLPCGVHNSKTNETVNTKSNCDDGTTSIARDTEKNESNKKKENKMQYQTKELNNAKYLFFQPGGNQIQKESDAIDLISLCAENDVTRILIDGERVPDDFFRLSTGIAGAIMQKLAQYGIKTVMVLDSDRAQGRFKEFLNESNSGQMFRAYDNYDEAEAWITST